jgi:hypothetical protein
MSLLGSFFCSSDFTVINYGLPVALYFQRFFRIATNNLNFFGKTVTKLVYAILLKVRYFYP